MAGLMQGQFNQMVDQLTKAVREVHLTVSWREGKQLETLDLVTHVVSMGPGSDRNGNLQAAQLNAAVNAQQQITPLVPGTQNQKVGGLRP
jgi:general secretion pathway protein I